MATIGSLAVAADIVNAALDYHVRGPALLQTIQDRPLLAFLNAGKETFPGGKLYITTPVQGAVMADTAGFFAGYTQDDALVFTQSANVQRAQYPWKEVHCGFVITQTELKQDGISLTDGEQSTSEHSNVSLTRLTAILKNRLADFSESYARSMNTMLWLDGSQDSKQIPGITALLSEVPGSGPVAGTGSSGLISSAPAAGTVGGISQATYTWWRNRANLTLTPSAENQTISKFFRNEILQLTRYGGKPNKAFCGSAFWDALMQEVEKKGIYTQSGFAGKDNDIGLNKISINGIGKFEYDPTLDTLGKSKYCYVLDGRRIKLQPMEGEENKTLKPARPYNYMVMLKSMTYTGGLTASQLNGSGVYAIA